MVVAFDLPAFQFVNASSPVRLSASCDDLDAGPRRRYLRESDPVESKQDLNTPRFDALIVNAVVKIDADPRCGQLESNPGVKPSNAFGRFVVRPCARIVRLRRRPIDLYWDLRPVHVAPTMPLSDIAKFLWNPFKHV